MRPLSINNLVFQGVLSSFYVAKNCEGRTTPAHPEIKQHSGFSSCQWQPSSKGRSKWPRVFEELYTGIFSGSHLLPTWIVRVEPQSITVWSHKTDATLRVRSGSPSIGCGCD